MKFTSNNGLYPAYTPYMGDGTIDPESPNPHYTPYMGALYGVYETTIEYIYTG